jgi:hypothetical protein
VKSEALVIFCLSLLAVPQTALGQSPVAGQGESEEDLRGPWLVTVHLATTEHAWRETQDFKATITFVPTATDHYTASGQVNAAPKTDEERIYNIYFQSCARGEGHDIAKTSAHTYKCSYEYGEANRYSDGTTTTTTTTVYKGDLTFELNNRALSGSTSFSIDVRQNGGQMATYSEEAEWTGKRGDDREDCATAQETVNLPRPRVEADQDKIQPLNTGVTAYEANSVANADEVAPHILIQSLRSGAWAEGILSAPEDASSRSGLEKQGMSGAENHAEG